jgi:quercetin dioxygenase-like cupin family protein
MRSLSWKAIVALVAAASVLAAFSIGVALAATAPAQKAIVDEYGNLRLRIVESEYTPTSADPRFDSGWHTHPGLAIVQVKSGTFDITQVGCTPTKVGPGQTFIEIPNTPVRAVSEGAIKWTTSLLLWNTGGSGAFAPAPLTPYAGNPCP